LNGPENWPACCLIQSVHSRRLACRNIILRNRTYEFYSLSTPGHPFKYYYFLGPHILPHGQGQPRTNVCSSPQPKCESNSLNYILVSYSLDAIQQYIANQRALLSRTQSDIDRLLKLRREAIDKPSEFWNSSGVHIPLYLNFFRFYFRRFLLYLFRSPAFGETDLTLIYRPTPLHST
jgi:hypothetical protein